jgi:hypothetical protein
VAASEDYDVSATRILDYSDEGSYAAYLFLPSGAPAFVF